MISIKKLRSAVAVLGALMAGGAYSAPIDLSSWKVDGGGNWTLFNSNNSVNQSLNSRPTVFFNDMDSQGFALSGTIRQGLQDGRPGGGDDDFFGFVLGYDDNDLFGTNPTTDYILVDWKQGTQGGWDAGMSISRVTGSIDASGIDQNADAWDHVGNVTFIQRAATLGNVGWVDNTEYLFDISFTSTNIRVEVDNVLQFDINGTFENGSFGFYNFSQPQVNYAGIEERIVPPSCGEPGQPPCATPVPEPGTAVLFGLGLLGLGWMNRKKA
tara:strand:+ start:8260 stop:9066 length:807 start_codon:yes stop_codon:yes gene_type:complete